MVNGLDKFREKFSKFSDGYAIIGGTACSVIMEHEGYTHSSPSSTAHGGHHCWILLFSTD